MYPLQTAFLSRGDWQHACFRELSLEVLERECHLQQFCLGLKCRTGVLWAHLPLLILNSLCERLLRRTHWSSTSSSIQMFYLGRQNAVEGWCSPRRCPAGHSLCSPYTTLEPLPQAKQCGCNTDNWPSHVNIHAPGTFTLDTALSYGMSSLIHLSIIWSFRGGEDMLQLCSDSLLNLCY